MKVEIRCGEVLEREMELAPGTYTIGRSNNCDIVLVDKRLSRKHAALIVTGNSWQIEDLGSANGVFVQGKRVKQRKKLGSDSQVIIGKFSFTVPRIDKVEKSKRTKNHTIQYLLNLAGGRPYISASVIIAICCLMSVFWIGMLNRSYLTSIVDEYERNEAWSVLDNIVYHNLNNWGQSDLSLFDISFYEKHQGVEHVYLIDQHGRVLAPLDKVNNVTEHPLIERSLKNGKAEWEANGVDKILLCKPVRKNGIIVGGAIVHYQMMGSLSLIRDRFGEFTGGLFIVLILSIGLSILLVKMLLQPWVRIGNAIERAVLEDSIKVEFKPAYKEIDHVIVQVERLLLKREREISSDREKASGNEYVTQADFTVEKKQGDLEKIVKETKFSEKTGLACLIDIHNNQIIDSTNEFGEMFNVEETSGSHILEVFQDASVLADVMALFLGDELSKEIEIKKSVFLGSKEIPDGHPGYLLLSFERKDD